jgi:hypothetical protein
VPLHAGALYRSINLGPEWGDPARIKEMLAPFYEAAKGD